MRLGKVIRSVLRVFFVRGAGGILSLGIAVLIANRFGASAPSDAFYLIRRLTLGLTEAAKRMVVVIYVPPIVAMLRANRTDSLKRLSSRHLSRVLVPVALLAAVAAFLAPWVISVLAPGFDTERQELGAALLRILVFVVPLHLLFAALTSVLYAFRRFVAPEFAAMPPRLLTIIVLFFLIPPLDVTALGWTILSGTLLGVVFLAPTVSLALRSGEMAPDPATVDDAIDPDLPEDPGDGQNLRKRIPPVVLLQVYRQVSRWIDLAFASLVMAGAVSIIEYAQRLAFIVPTLLITSYFTVFYTELAHDAVEGGARQLRRSVAVAMRVGLFVLVPLSAYLLTAANPIVDLVFKHGQFEDETARLTVLVIQILAPQYIVVFGMRSLIVGAYADKDAPHLQIVAWMVGMGLASRILALLVLPLYFGVAGLPAAMGVSTAIACITLYVQLARRWGPILQKPDLLGLSKIFVASGVAWLGMFGMASIVQATTNLAQFIYILALAIAGAALYLAAASLIGTEETRRMHAILRRRLSLSPDGN